MKKFPYILTIDQGTTSSRALVYSPLEQKIVAMEQLEFNQFFPHDGWVEHDLNEIWSTTLTVVRKVVERVGAEQLEAVGITNQRETTALWTEGDGVAEPAYHAIVWQDRRTTERCATLKKEGWEEKVHAKTGLFLDPYFCASKIEWLLQQDEVKKKAASGKLKFGTIDGFLLWNLTGQKQYTIDTTNASRTGIFNIHTKEWDRELLELYQIDQSQLPEFLPEVKPSNSLFGHCVKEIFGKELPIYGMVGDQQSSLFGHGGFEPGCVKSTYGTGAFLLINTGVPVKSNANLLTTIGIDLVGKGTEKGSQGVTHYALEGSIFIAGALFKWLKEKVALMKDYSTLNTLNWEKEEDDTYLVPAFSGLGAPYWNPRARGMLLGLTRDTDRNDILLAALKSMVYQTHDLLSSVEKDNIDLSVLKVDGGVSQNQNLCQYMSNLLNIKIERPHSVETTAIGAAKMAALGCGIFSNLDDIPSDKEMTTYEPNSSNKEVYTANLKKWQKAVAAVQLFAEE